MSNVVVYMSMSLDGLIAAENDGPGTGLGVGGEPLHAWLTAGNLDPETFRPENGVNAEMFDEMLSTGAVIVGRHTFEWAGEWGGDHHDGVPIFVLTRTEPVPAVRGFVNYVSDLGSAVARAKEAAGDRDVMMHGASSFQALLSAGLVDELAITLVPILLGRGKRLFVENADASELRLVSSVEGAGVLQEPSLNERPVRACSWVVGRRRPTLTGPLSPYAPSIRLVAATGKERVRTGRC